MTQVDSKKKLISVKADWILKSSPSMQLLKSGQRSTSKDPLAFIAKCLVFCSEPGKDWLPCITCTLWDHTSCANVPKTIKRFICELLP